MISLIVEEYQNVDILNDGVEILYDCKLSSKVKSIVKKPPYKNYEYNVIISLYNNTIQIQCLNKDNNNEYYDENIYIKDIVLGIS